MIVHVNMIVVIHVEQKWFPF